MSNFAFIDGQNVNLGIGDLGWKLSWRRFRVYLEEHYGVSRAYYFLGYIPEYQGLYTSLQNAGYTWATRWFSRKSPIAAMASRKET